MSKKTNFLLFLHPPLPLIFAAAAPARLRSPLRTHTPPSPPHTPFSLGPARSVASSSQKTNMHGAASRLCSSSSSLIVGRLSGGAARAAAASAGAPASASPMISRRLHGSNRLLDSNIITTTNLDNPKHRNNKHRSNAIDKIFEVEPVVIDGNLAVCDGGGGALGHPVEYITLKFSNSQLAGVCKYCGLRFVSSGKGGHGH